MLNVNQNIRETLIHYVTSPVVPQFAVMVKGKWGSGKTWLVKEVVASLIKEGRKVSTSPCMVYRSETTSTTKSSSNFIHCWQARGRSSLDEQ